MPLRSNWRNVLKCRFIIYYNINFIIHCVWDIRKYIYNFLSFTWSSFCSINPLVINQISSVLLSPVFLSNDPLSIFLHWSIYLLDLTSASTESSLFFPPSFLSSVFHGPYSNTTHNIPSRNFIRLFLHERSLFIVTRKPSKMYGLRKHLPVDLLLLVVRCEVCASVFYL